VQKALKEAGVTAEESAKAKEEVEGAKSETQRGQKWPLLQTYKMREELVSVRAIWAI